MEYFDSLIPGEKNVLTFNLANGLSSGVTLSGSPTVTVSTYIGTDPSPTSILNGSPIIDGTQTKVLVPVAVSNPFVDYLVTVLCGTTSATLTLGMPAILPVRAPS